MGSLLDMMSTPSGTSGNQLPIFFGTVQRKGMRDVCLKAVEDAGLEHIPSAAVVQGKIFWRGPLCIDRIQTLSVFEKVFLSVYHAGPCCWEKVAKYGDWEASVAAWERLCGPVRSFRVICNRAGKRVAGDPTSEDIERCVGSELEDKFAWRVELKQPHLQIWLFAHEEDTCVGLLLSRQVVQRGYLKEVGLHPNVAWALVTTAGVRPGEILLDPMCGRGVILAEVPASTIAIGVDRCQSQLQKARENLCRVRHSIWQLLQGDAQNLPLAKASIDVVVCDLPFGKQFGSVQENITLYPTLLSELWRVVKPGGRCVLLTSTPNGPSVDQGIHCSGWDLVERKEMKLAFKMTCFVYILRHGVGWEAKTSDVDVWAAGAGSWSKQWAKNRPPLELCNNLDGFLYDSQEETGRRADG